MQWGSPLLVLKRQNREVSVKRNYPGRRFKYEDSKPCLSSRFCRGSNPNTGIQKPASWEGGVRATNRETYSFFQEEVGALQTQMAEKRTPFFWVSPGPVVRAPCLTNLKCGADSHFWVERAAVSSEQRRNGAAPLVGRGPEHRRPDSGSPSSPLPTHQYIDVFLLREEGTHFLHISAKDGLDQGRLQGEPAFREPAQTRAEPGGGGSTRVGGGRRWKGSATGSRLQRIPAVPPPVARPPRTPAWRRRAWRGARRAPRESGTRAQSRPHIPGLAWRRRPALRGASGEGRER